MGNLHKRSLPIELSMHHFETPGTNVASQKYTKLTKITYWIMG